MKIEFTAHNLKLDDGSFTMGNFETLNQTPRWLSTQTVIRTFLAPGDSAIDIGSLEGGYTALMAQEGLNSTGLEIRESNLAAANFLKNNFRTDGHLSFKKGDMHNLQDFGKFDFTYCVGALYHSHQPRKLLAEMISATKKVLLIHTHVAPNEQLFKFEVGKKQLIKSKIKKDYWFRFYTHDLSKLTVNEGWKGRWYREPYESDENSFDENLKWASWGNAKSFWPTEEDLVSDLLNSGFRFVFHDFSPLDVPASAETINETINRATRRQYLAVR
jgi:SAM-dependent methyltransferase